MYDIDWSRSVHVVGPISDDLVSKLTPQILNLLGQSQEPITVGIDSPGGVLVSNDRLLGLLKSPTQHHKGCQVITVATNDASSAAANLLAYGDYALALPHASILFHDVRYGGLRDVTPDVAKTTAKQLSDLNDRYAVKLANHAVRRVVWVYLDLQDKFEPSKKKNSDIASRFEKCVISIPKNDNVDIDFVGFWAAIYERLSEQSQPILLAAIEKVGWWLEFQERSAVLPVLRASKSRLPGMLDGVDYMVRRAVADATKKNLSDVESLKVEEYRNLDLLVRLAAIRISRHRISGESTTGASLDSLIGDYDLITTMNDRQHIRSAARFITRHKVMFNGMGDFDTKSEEEKNRIVSEIFPVARFFWIFCVLLCRSLFDGEHILTPADAQLLGVIDEVVGGGPVESRREFNEKQKKERESEANTSPTTTA
ncbi:ATP-dependent Clp protease proteolytic subunit [Cupriavidus pauculus]|uniref:ATP-dependent Clp protease proteolytic subunit n=1 Tax=Cupriavidus pauculus TaxID=82633 RepID=UPI000A048C86|nr:ATP-dependent Clp protease proteolytic subunit [Cupriavidus pauculus]